jgi:hypothetical protein
MLSLVLALALAQSEPVAYNAPPNRFDTTEMGSEAIFVGMHVCFVQRGGFSPEKIPLCGCLMDATRLNVKRGKPNATPTPDQMQTCMGRSNPAPKSPPKPSKGKTGV